MTTTNEIRNAFEIALSETTNAHNKKAYKFAIDLLETMPNVEILLRENASRNAYNIGDLGEIVFKYHLNNNNELRYSLSGENDLDRVIKNEVKTFANSNRYPNGFTSPQGFYSISEFGIHYITKEMTIKYWNEFREHKDKRQPTYRVLKEIIANENPKMFISLTNKVFG